uniref:Type I restriction enzyme M protein n=1 Tax=Candidatus Kentrum eta TaxID=2126337 RepID=A0A450V0C0_9GAMM|nr:MAG: type I restriction enzyme M protein [Candidatus Kentron sp. H]VFJ98396.1 MAG: type I restriction enzyme M protein [Candidatus Kentron sp. H]VFK03528.1 MAG: type I restriction enzyme M protein [Candidatus Kentron sp. H]
MPQKKQIIDRASGRLITGGPEEIDALQPLLRILIDECGWDANQIVSRPKQWRVPSHPSGKRTWPVDIAIFDAPEKKRLEEHVKILCECKKPDETSGIGQLKVYLDREPHARVGIWFNGLDHILLYKTKDGYRSAPLGTPIPGPGDPLYPGDDRNLLTYPALRQAPSLVPLFSRIRNRLSARDRNVNRDEEILPDLSVLLLLKILDEQTNKLFPQSPLLFQIKNGSREETANNIKNLLQREVVKHSDIFGSSDIRLSIDDDSIAYVVEELQNYRLLSNDIDSISTAFQILRGKAYKGEEGQYFTPPSVVRISVAAIAPTSSDRIIDPACGSGSFLAGALNAVFQSLEPVMRQNPAEYGGVKRDWSTQNLYAMDKDSVSVRLSKAYLSLLGDGSSHVFKSDSLRPSIWPAHLGAIIPEQSFSAVLTNPPFGTKLKFSKDHGRAEGYLVCKKWVLDKSSGNYVATDEWENRELGIVFLERCLNLLEDSGRLAIVLPDTYLFSSSYQWLVNWLCNNFTITHTINVPIEAFEPHCRAKTSILVLKKQQPEDDHRIIGMLTESYGEDKHGYPMYRLDANGNRTKILEDEMAEAATVLLTEDETPSKLRFSFKQTQAKKAGVLVASYFWRKPYLDSLSRFARENHCELVSLLDLIDEGELTCESGHGSPKGQFKGKGHVPYIKVSDIKNWRINENPKYFIPEEEAMRLRGNKTLKPFDLVMPTRASKNIGLVGVIMPWQTHVVLTKEIVVIRCAREGRISPWLLLVMMSLRVVNDQFRYLVQMQTNREDLGKRFFELLIPIPTNQTIRNKWEENAKNFFLAQVKAREEYEKLLSNLSAEQFVDRP